MSLAHTLSPLVEQELQNDRPFHPNLGGTTRGGIANHYPMTVLALHRLGASDAEVGAFRDAWPRHRATMGGDLGLVDRAVVTRANWIQFLGQTGKLLEFRRVFEELLGEREDLEPVVHALVAMQNSLPMGLFHPLIRLSFAVAHGDRGLVADALAYMAIRAEDLFRQPILPLARIAGATRSAANVWRSVATDDALWRVRIAASGGAIRVCERLTGERALHLAALPPDFDLGAGVLSDRMREICFLALRLYFFSPSLSTLHAVTATQALAELTLRFGPAHAAAFAPLWQRCWVWLTALYLEKGRPLALPILDRDRVQPAHDWADLAARARAIPEVHLIKLAYSCRWLDETWGPEPLTKLAVANMVAERNAHPRSGAGVIPAAL